MPTRHSVARKRFFHFPCGGSPEHGHVVETVLEGLGVLSSIMFIAGSCCFMGGLPVEVTETGNMLFIMASLIYVVIAVHTLGEIHYSQGHGIVGNAEHYEGLAYLISAVVFSVGCILYWPGIYGAGRAERAFVGEEVAAICFIVGSLGFVIAAWLNSLSLSREELTRQGLNNAELIHRVSAWALFFSLMGGVAFTTGSWLYQPGLDDDCEELGRLGPRPGWCSSTLASGTALYIVGSVAYFVQSALNVLKLVWRVKGTSCKGWTGAEGGGAEREETLDSVNVIAVERCA